MKLQETKSSINMLEEMLHIHICDAPREKGTVGQNFRYWVFTEFWKSTVLGAIWCKILRNIRSDSGENSILLF